MKLYVNKFRVRDPVGSRTYIICQTIRFVLVNRLLSEIYRDFIKSFRFFAPKYSTVTVTFYSIKALICVNSMIYYIIWSSIIKQAATEMTITSKTFCLWNNVFFSDNILNTFKVNENGLYSYSTEVCSWVFDWLDTKKTTNHTWAMMTHLSNAFLCNWASICYKHINVCFECSYQFQQKIAK